MNIEIKIPSAKSPWKQIKYVITNNEMTIMKITPQIFAYPLLPFIVPIEITVTRKTITA